MSSNARVFDRDGRIGLVKNDLDEEIRWGLDLFLIGDGLVPDQDFLIGVESVDDQAHQLLDVGIEGKGLRHGSRNPGTMKGCDDNKTCTQNDCGDWETILS